MPTRQYRFPKATIINAGYAMVNGQETLIVDSVVPPRKIGLVMNQPPKKRPSYRERHRRRHTR